MTDFISKSPESSLSPQQQQTLYRQTEGPRIQAPATPSSTQPNRTSAHPVAPSLKYLQQLNHSIRAENDLVLSVSTSSSSSLPSQSFSSISSPFTPCPTGPEISGRVSAAISLLYQASSSSSDSSSVPRSNPSSQVTRLNGAGGGQSSRLHLPSDFTSSHIQESRLDLGFTEDTLNSLSTLMSPPQPQHQHQQQQQQQRRQQQQQLKLQKQTTPLVETTRTIHSPPLPPKSLTLATTAPLDSAAPSPCFSSSLSPTFLTPPPPPSPSPSSTLPSSSPAPVPSTPTTPFMSIITPEKISLAPCVSTATRKEDEHQKELELQKQTQEGQQLDGRKKKADLKGNGDIKGENESKEFENNINTTTAMSTKTTTITTTTTSSCDSTSTSASMPAVTTTATNAGQPAHTACVIPPVGRNNLRYGSLDAAAMNDEGTLLSMALIDMNTNKLRPMSSMEYAESPAWLLPTTPSDIDSPMTGTAASSRRPSADTGLEQAYVSAFHHHNNSIFGPLTMVTDQETAAAVSAAVSNAITNGPRHSSDQESVHPLQLEPEPRLSFDNNACKTSPSPSSSLPPPFPSLSSTGESWLSLTPPSSSSSNNTSSFSSDFAQSTSALTIQTQGGVVPHKTIRKKTSLASKIRKVFIKPMNGSNTSNNSSSNGSSNGSFSSKDQDVVDIHHSSSVQALEDIMSMPSRDGKIDTQGGTLRNGCRIGVAIGAAAGELCLPPPASHQIEHRGSVSSSSSGESTSVGQRREGGGLSPCTPSTSPEMSPSGSPKPKYALAPLAIGPSTAMAGHGIPDGHPLSPVEINNHLTVSPKSLEKRMSLEPASNRTSKKRLSFASITSFFNTRNADAMAASKKKQQRSSSVPNVESPLTGAGRQQQGSAAFQRRHSLNDLETGPQLQAKFAAPPWDKDRISAQAAAAAAEALAHKATENESSSSTTTMSKIQGVFGKQSKKNKSKKGASHSENAPIVTAISSAKPLRSALAHRPVRAPSVRKVQVVHRHQGSTSTSDRRLHHQVEPPLVNLSQEPVSSNSTNDSRRNSEEHSGRTGPTRHRRQSSIAGRQASQQGHYPQIERKQRLSVRYSSSEEYDIVHQSDLYALDQHQQQQQLQQQQQQQQQIQYHGGYVQYDGSIAPQTPHVNPVSTKPMTPRASEPSNYPLVNISPCTSRGAVAEGSFTFSPAGSRQRDSYISCSSHGSPSKDTSPKLASLSTPRQQQHQQNYAGSPASAVAAAIGNPHRRSSYDATSNNRRSSYEANSRRNSMVVTSSVSSPLSPPSSSAPVARLSVDHTLMSDHPGPSSSPSVYPQAITSVNGGHQLAIFANHQQQKQLQLQQQMHYQQQQQQFQRNQQHHHHQQMHYIPDHHQHHHHHQYQQQQHQQFMNPHAGSQTFHEQYHIQQKQQYPPQSPQSYQQYPPYPYQYNMQQPLPSHLYYTSVQHPALAYTGVNSSTIQPPPPPPLQYLTNKSSGNGSGGGNGGNPSPTSCSSISPSPSPSTPPRRPNRQLHFSTAQPQIQETWTPDQYDRTSDPNITAQRLTPAIAQRIKLELNTFKSQEMLVHQESRENTHFFT